MISLKPFKTSKFDPRARRRRNYLVPTRATSDWQRSVGAHTKPSACIPRWVSLQLHLHKTNVPCASSTYREYLLDLQQLCQKLYPTFSKFKWLRSSWLKWFWAPLTNVNAKREYAKGMNCTSFIFFRNDFAQGNYVPNYGLTKSSQSFRWNLCQDLGKNTANRVFRNWFEYANHWVTTRMIRPAARTSLFHPSSRSAAEDPLTAAPICR